MSQDDPSLQNNYIQIHQAQILFSVSSHKKILSFDDILMIRIFKNPTHYKIQLTSENNINFLYRIVTGPESKRHYTKNTCSLEDIEKMNGMEFADYEQFGLWAKKLLNPKGEEKSLYKYKFDVESKTEGILSVMKKQNYKEYPIGVLKFQSVPMEELNQNLMYRYEKMAIRKKMLEKYLADMITIIKTKNPTLYSNIRHQKKKNPPAFK